MENKIEKDLHELYKNGNIDLEKLNTILDLVNKIKEMKINKDKPISWQKYVQLEQTDYKRH
jgi:mRNA-degrading endonuclease YafQ of YafQ-DinJ toxin-antitoxin module